MNDISHDHPPVTCDHTPKTCKEHLPPPCNAPDPHEESCPYCRWFAESQPPPEKWGNPATTSEPTTSEPPASPPEPPEPPPGSGGGYAPESQPPPEKLGDQAASQPPPEKLGFAVVVGPDNWRGLAPKDSVEWVVANSRLLMYLSLDFSEPVPEQLHRLIVQMVDFGFQGEEGMRVHLISTRRLGPERYLRADPSRILIHRVSVREL